MKLVAGTTVSGVVDVAEPPLTTMVNAPVAAPAGITNASVDAVVEEAGAVMTPPLWLASVTCATVPEPGCRFVPWIVTGVPMGPDWGLKLMIVGGGRLVTVRAVEPVSEGVVTAAPIVVVPALFAVTRP